MIARSRISKKSSSQTAIASSVVFLDLVLALLLATLKRLLHTKKVDSKASQTPNSLKSAKAPAKIARMKLMPHTAKDLRTELTQSLETFASLKP
jgi:hypothetical protein